MDKVMKVGYFYCGIKGFLRRERENKVSSIFVLDYRMRFFVYRFVVSGWFLLDVRETLVL